ncbi:hypothetical protein FCV82_02235 [Vibrio breoganii]|uniref:hypothetical protein n=1 Tax=Vibrio breoganii TaxID=553239 RepID=UPI000C827F7B|nr:hypothetical protein [Vibrio breoganii]PMN67115.1 hypothetical protein BCT28_03940 [Vibrio breoganii]PMO82908.1 hypothetical protein BCT00_06660 [Vibrio breoganii]TKF90411.1 hypothetical protein FCV82_02235 [Vibrio breoganii]
MIIEIEANPQIITYQYDDSVQGTIPQDIGGDDPAGKAFSALVGGLPTSGITTDPMILDHNLYVNLDAISEVRIFENVDNYYALASITESCTKLIVFGRGLQTTILAFEPESIGEFQRIKRIVTEQAK